MVYSFSAKKFMWENYYQCTDPYKRVLILEKIVRIQPFLSAYYEATKDVMKESNLMKKHHIPVFEKTNYIGEEEQIKYDSNHQNSA